ncbi:MAG TPA: formylglycine-generating enzyme family protein [Pirellulales bacterium]
MNRVACCLSLMCLWWSIPRDGISQEADSAAPAAHRAGETIANSLGMKLTLIPAGEFQMGSDERQDVLEKAFESKDDPGIAIAGDVTIPATFDPPGFPEFSRPKDYTAEQPAHRVKITRPFYMSKFEVTNGQFARFVEAASYKTDAERDGKGGWQWVPEADTLVQKPEYTWRDWQADYGDECPVVNVSWNDAVAFCKWLSAQEGKTYRLPTEAEWEYACRAGSETRFYRGDDEPAVLKIANVRGFRLVFNGPEIKKENFTQQRLTPKPQDGYPFVAPAGQFRRNRFNLYDITGNVSEWCADWFSPEYYSRSPAADPAGPESGISRVLRGGGWDSAPIRCRSAFRSGAAPDDRFGSIGFRVVLNADVGAAEVRSLALEQNETKDNSGPAENQVKQPPQVETITNTLGMKLARVPAGEFTMGSDESLAELKGSFIAPGFFDQHGFAAERPAHTVRISMPFYMGVYEVTNGQFQKFADVSRYETDAEKDGEGGYGLDTNRISQNPKFNWRSWGYQHSDDRPVVNVSWNDAVAFCEWLSAQEGKTYRLPTEAEWEYACRAGSETRFYNGDDPQGLTKIGNVPDSTFKRAFPSVGFALETKDGYVLTAPVGRFLPNRFGLYDMAGNVSEWCFDVADPAYYASSPTVDPRGPHSGEARAIRGGGWSYYPLLCRSSSRIWEAPTFRRNYLGFRVIREQEKGDD